MKYTQCGDWDLQRGGKSVRALRYYFLGPFYMAIKSSDSRYDDLQDAIRAIAREVESLKADVHRLKCHSKTMGIVVQRISVLEEAMQEIQNGIISFPEIFARSSSLSCSTSPGEATATGTPGSSPVQGVAAEKRGSEPTHGSPGKPPPKAVVMSGKGPPRGGRRQKNYSSEVVQILDTWFEEHKNHPYPSAWEKDLLALRTELSKDQIRTWFTNKRRRNGCKREDTDTENPPGKKAKQDK